MMSLDQGKTKQENQLVFLKGVMGIIDDSKSIHKAVTGMDISKPVLKILGKNFVRRILGKPLESRGIQAEIKKIQHKI